MKVILWGINYRPESTGIAPFNAELAEHLARGDHEVSVVTGFAYYPHWRKNPGDKHRLYRSEQISGVKVFRCAQYVPRRVTTARRIAHELSFGISSFLRVILLPRADVYVVVSPPLLLGFCAWIATLVKRSRYVFHVQDLQPGAAVGLGMVNGRWFIRLLYALEKIAYRRAAAVSGISDGMMQELSRKGVRGPKRIYFPNWLRNSAGAPARRGEFRRRFDIPANHLLAVYSGNLGRKQGIDILLETAQRLRTRADGVDAPVTIVIAGDGAERPAVAARISALNLDHLRLLPLLGDDDYQSMLADADVGLITQAHGTGRYFFPSKLLSLLQAGLPVATVADSDSELARAVAEGGFGINVTPGHAAELADALSRLSSDSVWRRQLREHTGWVNRFDPELVLPQFVRQLEGIVPETDGAPDLVREQEPSRL